MGMLAWGSQEIGPGIGGGGASVVVNLLSYIFYLGFYFLRDMEPFEDLKWDAGMRRE